MTRTLDNEPPWDATLRYPSGVLVEVTVSIVRVSFNQDITERQEAPKTVAMAVVSGFSHSCIYDRHTKDLMFRQPVHC